MRYVTCVICSLNLVLKNRDKLMESRNPSNPVPMKFLLKRLFNDRQCSLFVDVEMCFAMYEHYRIYSI